MTEDIFEVEVSFESDHNEVKPSARGVDLTSKNLIGETIFDEYFGSGEDSEFTTQSTENFTPAVTVKTEILEKFEDPQVLYESVQDLLERWNIKSTSQTVITALATRTTTKPTTMLASTLTTHSSQIKNDHENKSENKNSLIDQISLKDEILVADQALTTIEGTTFVFSTTTVSTIEYSTTLTTTEQTTTETALPLQKSIFQNPHIPLFSFVQRNERVIPNSPTARVITTPTIGKMTTSEETSTSSTTSTTTSSTTSTTKTTSTSSITLSTLSQKKVRQLEKARMKRINGLKSQMMKKFFKQKAAEEKRNRNQVRALVKNAKQTKEKQKRMRNQFVLEMRRLDSLETQRIQAEMREIELQNAIEARKNREFFDLIEKINTTTTTTTTLTTTTTKTTVTSTSPLIVPYSTQKPTQNTLTKSDGKLNFDDLRVFLPSNLLPSLEPGCQKFAILISKMMESRGRMNKNFFDHQLKRCRIYNLRNAILHFIGKF